MIIRNCSRIGGFHNPALDVSEPAEHAEQVERWLIQMAGDAGLTGMEQLVSEMRSKVARLCASGFCPVQSSEMPGLYFSTCLPFPGGCVVMAPCRRTGLARVAIRAG